MYNNLKDIPNSFLRNTNEKNSNSSVYISSMPPVKNISSQKDSIWLLIMFLIVFDMI